MKKIVLKSLPYLICLIVGSIFLIVTFTIPSEELKGLYSNLAATFFGIPLVFLVFETTKAFSNRKLNAEIFDYVKMLVDTQALSATKHLIKMVYSYERNKNTFGDIVDTINLKKEELATLLKTEKRIGFQIFKKFEVDEQNIQSLLNNSLLLQSMSNEQIICIIKLLQSMRQLSLLRRESDLFIATDEKLSNYKAIKGSSINPTNNILPNRYMLLKSISNDKSLVVDFGDFTDQIKEDCNKVYEVNIKQEELLIETLFELLSNVNNWLAVTGNEFIIDQKIFRSSKKAP